MSRGGLSDPPTGVEVVKTDAADVEQCRKVCEAATVAYNCANAPYTDWPRLFPAILNATASKTDCACANGSFRPQITEPLCSCTVFIPTRGMDWRLMSCRPTSKRDFMCSCALSLSGVHLPSSRNPSAGRPG